jgi:DNA polymerase-3 subunit epsilon
MKEPDYDSSYNRPRNVLPENKVRGWRGAISSMFGLAQTQHQSFIRSVMKDQRQTSVFELPLADLQAVVFDLETTGFNPEHDEILSVGAVLCVGSDVHAEHTFYSMVKPNRKIPANIVELTNITDEMAADAPDVREVLTNFLRFVQRRVLIAHGTGHDKQFLNVALWRMAKIRLSHRVLDTILVARWLNPRLPSYDLDTVLDAYGIPIQDRHHALSDAIMTARLWSEFMREIASRRITTLGDLYAHLSQHV